jgi:hypothetical protein
MWAQLEISWSILENLNSFIVHGKQPVKERCSLGLCLLEMGIYLRHVYMNVLSYNKGSEKEI